MERNGLFLKNPENILADEIVISLLVGEPVNQLGVFLHARG
jgi:hypothetical protein